VGAEKGAHVVTNLSGLADDCSQAMVDEETPSNNGTRMDLYTSQAARDVAEHSGKISINTPLNKNRFNGLERRT